VPRLGGAQPQGGNCLGCRAKLRGSTKFPVFFNTLYMPNPASSLPTPQISLDHLAKSGLISVCEISINNHGSWVRKSSRA
jgi:hypothetical protein